MLTSLLVVVNAKKVEQFLSTYENLLLTFNIEDLENWKKKTRSNIEHANQNLADENQRREIIEAEYAAAVRKHEKEMQFPGVIPQSHRYLGQSDEEGNQLWRVTVMKDQVATYIRLLQKATFRCAEF